MRRSFGGTVLVRTASAVAVVALVASGACSGSEAADVDARAGGEKEAAASSTTTTAPGPKQGSAKSGSTEAGAKGGKDAAGATTTTAPAGGGGSEGSKAAETPPTTEDPFRMTLPITAEVGTACVRPGATQTITVKAPYGSGIGYDVMYADGLSGMMEGHYGGNFGGYADEQGTFVHTFPVAATAPPGRAVANVLGTHMHHGFGETHAWFAVADALGNCDPPARS